MALPEIVGIEETIALLGLATEVTDPDLALMEQIKGYVEDDFRSYCRHDITQPASPYVEFYPKVDRPIWRSEDQLVSIDQAAENAVYGGLSVKEGDVIQLDHIFARDDASLAVREDRSAYFGMDSDDFAASTALTSGTDFFLELDRAGLCKSGRLFRRDTDWTSKAGQIRVTYNAGLSTTDLDQDYRWLKGAVVEVVARRFRKAKSGGGAVGQTAPIKAESFSSEYSVTYAVEQAEIGEVTLPTDVKRKLRRGGLVSLGGFLDL